MPVSWPSSDSTHLYGDVRQRCPRAASSASVPRVLSVRHDEASVCFTCRCGHVRGLFAARRNRRGRRRTEAEPQRTGPFALPARAVRALLDQSRHLGDEKRESCFCSVAVTIITPRFPFILSFKQTSRAGELVRCIIHSPRARFRTPTDGARSVRDPSGKFPIGRRGKAEYNREQENEREREHF